MNAIINHPKYNLNGKSAIITGGGGLLGPEHATSLARWGAKVILLDIEDKGLEAGCKRVIDKLPNCSINGYNVDITDEEQLLALLHKLQGEGIEIDILVNNACLNPKMDSFEQDKSGTVEGYNMDVWNAEIQVGITGTFLCCKVFGSKMAERGGGSIVNVASDLAIQAPDQRVYSSTGKMEDVEHFKPIGYPVVKAAMLGLNRYLATYWAHRGVRVNCLIPGAVKNTQSPSLLHNITERVPLQRLAFKEEYQEAIAFLASDASSYMTGQELVMDGGRSIW
jgi:NAD(P)-dependent dehydrogenase (short-subunit alcohol dehydrogenase family)